jgi:hypothetical protein
MATGIIFTVRLGSDPVRDEKVNTNAPAGWLEAGMTARASTNSERDGRVTEKIVYVSRRSTTFAVAWRHADWGYKEDVRKAKYAASKTQILMVAS